MGAMLSALLIALVLAVDPLGEPHALKRAVFLSLGPLLFLLTWPTGRLKQVANRALGFGLGAGFLAFGIALATNPVFDPTFRGGASLASFLLFLLCAAIARDDAATQPYALTITALALGALSAIYAIVQRIGFDPLFDNPGREAVAFFGNTNQAGEFLAPMLPLALASIRTLSRATRRLGAITLPLATAALLLTSSRGAVIAAAVGLIAIVLVRGIRRHEIAIIVLGAALPLLVGGIDSYRLKSVEESEASITSAEYAPNKQRLALANSTIAMIAAAPVIGHGAGSFRENFGEFRDPAEARLPTAFGVLSSAEDPHVQYLLTAAEIGIPAALLLALLFLSALASVRFARSWPDEHPIRDTTPGLAAALLALLVLGLFRSFLDHAPVALLAFAITGALLAANERGRETDPRPLATLLLPLWLVAIVAVGSRSLYSEFQLGVAARAIANQNALAAEDAYAKGRSVDDGNLALLEREAALLDQHARIEPSNDDIRKRAVAAREHLAIVDPWNATNHLRLAARAIERDRLGGVAHHLAKVSRILGEKSPWALATRIADCGELDAAIRYLVTAARQRRITIAELREAADRAKEQQSTARALLALLPCLELRPDDPDLALEVGSQLADSDPLKNAMLRRAHLGFAFAALARRDQPSARKSLDIARRYGTSYELGVAFALAAALEGDRPNIEQLLAKRPEAGPEPWLEPMLKPLRGLTELDTTFERLDR